VVLETGLNQRSIQARLDGQDGAGKWHTLANAAQVTEVAPLLGLRRAAIAELKRRGFTHMVVWNTDYAADDYRKKASLWGIRAIAEDDDGVLYEL
jgi:aspartate/glutamate racemase